jgi:hypothetical protein
LALLKPLFPRAPHPAVVINVVKNASHPEPALVTGPRREAFHILGWLDCNYEQTVMQVVSAPSAVQILRRNKQGMNR